MTVKLQPKLTVPASLPTSRPTTQAAPTRVGPNAQRQTERSTFEPPAIRYTGRPPVLTPPRLPGSNDTHRPESYTGQPHGPAHRPGWNDTHRPESYTGRPHGSPYGIERHIDINPNGNRPSLPGGTVITGPDEHCPHHTSGGPVINAPPVGIVPDGVDPLALARRLGTFRG